MPTPYRKPKSQAKPMGFVVTCPSCGRKGKAAKAGTPVRCSECGKEFKAGDRGTGRRNFILGVLGLIAAAVAAFFGVARGQRIDGEQKAKDAEDERRRKAAEKDK
jgi:uncharacterized protein (DUF983 family)